MDYTRGMRLWILVSLSTCLTLPLGAEILRVGVAIGFPPYQYAVEGQPAGLDVDLARAVAAEAGATLVWTQGPWDDMMAILRTSRDLDLVVGMEKTGDRPSLFLLGRTLYSRKNLLFVLESESKIRKLEDLAGLVVARDRDAFSEEILDDMGLKSRVRLMRTDSKEAAFAALVTRKVAAVFMPEAVGWTLARQAGVAVRTIDFGDPGSPVGLAFNKGNEALALRMNAAVDRLEKKGTLAVILEKWRSSLIGVIIGR